MIGDKNDDDWTELCKLAGKERDPKKLSALIAEITRLLTAKQQRVKTGDPPAHRETGTPNT